MLQVRLQAPQTILLQSSPPPNTHIPSLSSPHPKVAPESSFHVNLLLFFWTLTYYFNGYACLSCLPLLNKMVITWSISFYKFLFAVSKLLENMERSQSRTSAVFLPCSMVRPHRGSLSRSMFALSHCRARAARACFLGHTCKYPFRAEVKNGVAVGDTDGLFPTSSHLFCDREPRFLSLGSLNPSLA